jgi:hypothetical protein
MSSQLEIGPDTRLNANAALIAAFTCVILTAAAAIDLPANGGAKIHGVTQQDIAIGAYGPVKGRTQPGTFMIRTAVQTVCQTEYSIDATGVVVAIGSSPNDVARVRAVRNAASGAVNEFIFV